MDIFMNQNGCYVDKFGISKNIINEHPNKYGDVFNLYGTKEEMENWKYFILNNKLPLFINLVLSNKDRNTTFNYIPWVVDKKYTDEELYKLFNLSDVEVKFIDKTLRKYEQKSPWFKRYLGGKQAASDEEVQKYINSI